ncbi:hypothetical protein F2P79_008302 [Pimephales promelas]|nr:hypothetical protein F2P79_008302 [Pimephales promelas]
MWQRYSSEEWAKIREGVVQPGSTHRSFILLLLHSNGCCGLYSTNSSLGYAKLNHGWQRNSEATQWIQC